MVLNIGEDNVSRRDTHEDSSDHRCSPVPSDSNSPTSYNHHISTNGYSRQYENNHRNTNGSSGVHDNTSTEAPLDFSVRRRYSSNGEEAMQEDDDVKPPLSPTDSEVGSSNGVGSPINDRGRHHEHLNNSYNNQDRVTNGFSDKIGEPRLALPGLLPISRMTNPSGFVMPPGFPPGFLPNMGMFGPLPPLVIDPNTHNQQVNADQNGKNNRPFKAYPKDPLSLPMGYFGMPGAPPLPGLDITKAQALSQNAPEEMLKRYKEYMALLQKTNKQMLGSPKESDNHHDGRLSPISPPAVDRFSTQSPPICSPHTPPPHVSSANYNSPSLPTNRHLNENLNNSQNSGIYSDEYSDNARNSHVQSSGPTRKRGRLHPEESKDASYWERRRKNNEAAKRSRDARRAKEDEIAIRAAFLEQENLKLRVEVAALKNETAKLRCMLYNS